MNVSRREWLSKIGFGAAALGFAAPSAHGDEGDPAYAGFNACIKKIPPSLNDVPSAYLEQGKVIQPARELPIFHTADVIVVGGGPAGWGAAMGAAQTGAKVAIIERDGSFGGLWTNGGVLLVIGNGVMKNGTFKQVTCGVCADLLRRLAEMSDDAITRQDQPTANPEAVKTLMDQMLLEKKVDVFLRCWGVDVIQTGSALKGVVFESKQGRQAILAKTIVDASGDGDVFFQAGATYQQILHGMGFVYRTGNADRVDKEKARTGKLRMGSYEAVSSAHWHNVIGPQGNGLDVRNLSRIEMDHRKQAWDYVQKIRKTEGCSEVFLMQTCPQVGVRATRLLDGVAQISKRTAAEQTRFEDVVAVGGHDGLRLPEFQIPYRALLPRQVDHLLVAGRCISCATDLIDRARLIPVCIVTGHAAGVAAALAALKGTLPREVPVPEIQKVLKEQGAYLG